MSAAALESPAMTLTLKWCTCCIEKLSNTVKCLHCLLVVETAYTTPQSLKTGSGHQFPSLVSWIHFAVGTKPSSMRLRSLSSIADATDSRSLKNVSAVCSRESEITSSAFFDEILLQKSLHVIFRLLHSIPTGGEHTFYFSGIPPSDCPQATALRLSISCITGA